MSNVLLLLMLAVLAIFVIARLLKDAKAFVRLIATFALCALVGAGVHQALADAPEKATVVSTENAVPMQSNISPFVVEDVTACPDSASQEITARDSVETYVEGLPTTLGEVEIQDDS